MQGVPFRVDGKGRVLVSWMSRHKAYWAISDEGGQRFGPAVPTPGGGKQKQAFPVALANRKGEVLFVWKEGDQVSWALYTLDGKPTGVGGRAGSLPGPNKPTAFVGSDDQFYIVF